MLMDGRAPSVARAQNKETIEAIKAATSSKPLPRSPVTRSQSRNNTVTPATAQVSTPAPIVTNAFARMKKASKNQSENNSAKGLTLSEMLVDMCPVKFGTSQVNRNAVPAALQTADNKAKYRHAMDLINKEVDLPGAKAVLMNDLSPDMDKKSAADSIQEQCMEKLLQLELECGIRNPGDKVSTRIKPCTMGIGMRCQKVKSKRAATAKKERLANLKRKRPAMDDV